MWNVVLEIKNASLVGEWDLEGKSALLTLWTELSGSLGGCKMVIILFIIQFVTSTSPKTTETKGKFFFKTSFQVGMDL